MTMYETNREIHPVLDRLGWSWPIAENTSWTLTELDVPGAPPRCRLTHAADGDLIVELAESPNQLARYVFDRHGQLVALSQDGGFTGPLFAQLVSQIMDALCACCGDGRQSRIPPGPPPVSHTCRLARTTACRFPGAFLKDWR